LQWPTYKTFIKLLDNYETGTGVAEVVTAEEEQENWAFINACVQTKVSAYLTLYVFIIIHLQHGISLMETRNCFPTR
jgi:hypothetical protein